MPAHRVNLIGASGVGNTTLGRRLASALGWPYFDSDDYYHEPTDPPFRVQRLPTVRCAMVLGDLEPRDAWVLSGMVAAWDPEPVLDYTLLVFLYLPPEIRLLRLREREVQRYGSRISERGDMQGDHAAFMHWTEGYDAGNIEGTNTLRHHRAFAERAKCPVLNLHTPMTTEEQLRQVLATLDGK